MDESLDFSLHKPQSDKGSMSQADLKHDQLKNFFVPALSLLLGMEMGGVAG